MQRSKHGVVGRDFFFFFTVLKEKNVIEIYQKSSGRKGKLTDLLTTSRLFLASCVQIVQVINFFLEYENVKLLVVLLVLAMKEQVIIGYLNGLKKIHIIHP